MKQLFHPFNLQTCTQHEHIICNLSSIEIEQLKSCRDPPLPMCQVQSSSITGRHSQHAATSRVSSSPCWSTRMAETYQTLSTASTACKVGFRETSKLQ